MAAKEILVATAWTSTPWPGGSVRTEERTRPTTSPLTGLIRKPSSPPHAASRSALASRRSE